MLVERAIHEPCNFPCEEAAPREQFHLCVIVTLFAQNRQHFFPEQFSVFGGIQTQQLSVDSEHHQLSFVATRRVARRVRFFIRSISPCRLRRPCGVRRYAWRPLEVSSSSKRSIQSSSSNRRSAPYNVPVLRTTRPSLMRSTSFRIE